MAMNALCIFELAFLSIFLILSKTPLTKKKYKFIYIKNVRLGNYEWISNAIYTVVILLWMLAFKLIICLKIVTRLKLSQSLQNR